MTGKKIIALITGFFMLFITGCAILLPVTDNSIQPPEINSFIIVPAIISSGETAVLTWQISNADEIIIEPTIGTVLISGSKEVNPLTNTVYTVIARNKKGVSKAEIILTVQEIEKPITTRPVINSFKIYPNYVSAGAPATLSWDISDATFISIDWKYGNYETSSEITGSIAVRPVIPTLYTLLAENKNGMVTATSEILIKADVPFGNGGGGQCG